MKQVFLMLLFVCSALKNIGQNSPVSGTAVNSIQPKIIVIPRVSSGQDKKVFFDSNMNIQIAIAKVNEVFQKRGANLRNFDQVVRQLADANTIDKAAGNQEDAMSMLLQRANADVYVEIKLDVVNHTSRNAKSVTVILDAYQAGTGNSLASKSFPSPMFQTEDIGRLIMMAMDKEADAFLNLIQLKWDDIVLNGQSVYVEFSIAQGSKYTFDSEMGKDGKLFSELIDDWFRGHSKNGSYNNQGVTANKLIISDVRIPLKRPDNPNQNYTGQNLFTDIRQFLKSLGINSKRMTGDNNKIFISIQ